MKMFKTVIIAFMVIAVNAHSAFADVTINGTKVVKTDSNTVFKVDDKVVTESEFSASASGQVATVSSSDSDQGAESVSTENHIKGPVTSLDPFQVFGQDVVIDNDTVLDNNNGTFALGDLLEVSGYFDTNNVFLATRVEKDNSLDEWKVFGYIQSVTGSTVTIGQLSFDTSMMTLTDCSSPLATGDLVKIELDPIMNFDATMPIDAASSFECKSSVLDIPDDQNGDFEFEVEGFVTSIIDPENFMLNGQQVMITANTTYKNGTAADIVEGVKLEAEGQLDATTNILTAAKIKFKNTKVKIIGPVSSADLDTNQVTIMGITAVFNAFSEDDDNVIETGITTDVNLKVEGFVDSAGNVFAEEIRVEGDANAQDVRLDGPVANIGTDSFTILGVNIDTTSSTFVNDEVPSDAATFFANVQLNSIVEINHGSYDATTNTISGGEISLENVNGDDAKGSTASKASFAAQAAGAAAVNYGTVTAFQAAQPAPAPVTNTGTGGGGSTDLLLLSLLGLLIASRKMTR